MKLEFKLAYKNIIGAGLRTWLNVAILSFIYVLIIGSQGIYDGMMKQGVRVETDDRIAGGQFWHKDYDPNDPFSYDDSHAELTAKLQDMVISETAVPMLIKRATIYPDGRMKSVLIRGIKPMQDIVKIPTNSLGNTHKKLPVMIGTRMASTNNFQEGDYLTIRLRDIDGTFDAVEGRIVKIMSTRSVTIDKGQLWIPIQKLREITGMKNETTVLTIKTGLENIPGDTETWSFKDRDYLLRDIIKMVKSKKVSGLIMYMVLLFLALLAVFDTQVLAIFKRRKEIGTLIALGMTRSQVVKLFTLEGAMHGVLAALVGALYGTPLIYLFAKTGMDFTEVAEAYGMGYIAMLYPVYSAGLVIGTVFIVMLTVTVVSFIPSRKIATLDPTKALKGKVS